MTRIKFLAFKGAPERLFERGRKHMNELFPDAEFDGAPSSPDILAFLSGGSEREALKYAQQGKLLVLAAFEENNSYAAATEVKAYFDSIGQECRLADINDAADRQFIADCIRTEKAEDRLNGKRLGLIGEISDWLVASDIAGDTLSKKLGIELVRIPWKEVRAYTEFSPAPDFISMYATDGTINTIDAGRVHQALADIVARRQLDAITVECFSLVKGNSVTACLALSKLNDDGIAAGCEGDLASIAGIMLVKEVTGIIPWMANTVKVDDGRVKFAHCTAPTKVLSKFKIDTHYETGLGTAIAGEFAADEVTIFRIDSTLEKAFAARGTIVSRPASPEACRTQIEVSISGHASSLIKHKPLGNHHLIIPGDHIDELRMFCMRKNIELIM
jgi:L-fucose isomerase-like protein